MNDIYPFPHAARASRKPVCGPQQLSNAALDDSPRRLEVSRYLDATFGTAVC